MSEKKDEFDFIRNMLREDRMRSEQEDSPSWAGALLVVMLGGLITWGVVSCDQAYDLTSENYTATVTEVGDCTNATSDAWNGRSPGYCRTVLDNGEKLTVARPVDVGDKLDLCRTNTLTVKTGVTEVGQWRRC